LSERWLFLAVGGDVGTAFADYRNAGIRTGTLKPKIDPQGGLPK